MSIEHKGFTLIELIIVIAVIGVLAAVATPKFIDLRNDAYDAQVKSLSAAITSTSTTNFSQTLTSPGNGVVVSSTFTCANVATNFAPAGSLVIGASGDADWDDGALTLASCATDGTKAGIVDATCNLKSLGTSYVGTATLIPVRVVCTK